MEPLTPLPAKVVAEGKIRRNFLFASRSGAYWCENRPLEKGRTVIMHWAAGSSPIEISPPDTNVRSRIHEYGGRPFVAGNSSVYFINDTDRSLYLKLNQGAPRKVLGLGKWNLADLCLSPDGKTLFAIGEHEGADALVAININDATPEIQILHKGSAFYSAPSIHPDGTKIAWITWDPPQMPWDGSDLWVATIQSDGTLSDAQHFAGGPEESILQPQWSPHGVLHWISDRSGYWNIYRAAGNSSVNITPQSNDFGSPPWVLGGSWYAFAPDGSIFTAYYERGTTQLCTVPSHGIGTTPINSPYTDIGFIHVGESSLYFFGGSPTSILQVVASDLQNGTQMLWISPTPPPSPDTPPTATSLPEEIEFSTTQGQTARAFFYPPSIPGKGALPPLIIRAHGGPTGFADTTLDLTKQFWTSRGYAFAEVNFRGSSGYGRVYREALNGNWGVVDVDDCVACAQFLARAGRIDEGRVAISGGSSGGYTALCAMARPGIFAAAASYYGISDLELMVKETHRFEAHYFTKILGPYPEKRELYRSRSPLSMLEKLTGPIIFFQGSEDLICPPSQTEAIYQALLARGIHTRYLKFDGEGHGFRRAESIISALEAEYAFYEEVLYGGGANSPESDSNTTLD
jgi:dipeptidyl aminopeptidase/acylaminoacyl peptidase